MGISSSTASAATPSRTIRGIAGVCPGHEFMQLLHGLGGMGCFPLLFALVTRAILAGSALAQQPLQPLLKVGSCPLGYDSSGSYCVKSR